MSSRYSYKNEVTLIVYYARLEARPWHIPLRYVERIAFNFYRRCMPTIRDHTLKSWGWTKLESATYIWSGKYVQAAFAMDPSTRIPYRCTPPCKTILDSSTKLHPNVQVRKWKLARCSSLAVPPFFSFYLYLYLFLWTCAKGTHNFR